MKVSRDELARQTWRKPFLLATSARNSSEAYHMAVNVHVASSSSSCGVDGWM
jgi:hypothetical protein